jgi:DNA helicase-2/ATP-dependent DNA helicase PcrA
VTVADEKIADAIRDGRSFLLDAGAGSGKTFSLVLALTVLRDEFRDALLPKHQQIACITYTNAAKNQILERIEYDDSIRVSTIHDFLWNLIKPFQREAKMALRDLNAELPAASRRKQDPDELDEALGALEAIVYSDRGSKFLAGRIFHDDLIRIAALMFEKHPRLSVIAGAKYPFLFVDEYQDTFADVVEILLDGIRVHAPHVVIGFFGDSHQAIFENVVGELSEEHRDDLEMIVKEENYRCATAVIDLLNRFRTDIQQQPAGENVEGAALYVGFAKADDDSPRVGYDLARPQLEASPEFDNAKVLYLTHRLIARKTGYGDLHDAYRARGGFALDRFQFGEDTVAKWLAFEVIPLATSWSEGASGEAVEILRRNGFSLESYAAKKAVADSLEQLALMMEGGHSIGAVIQHIQASELLIPVDAVVDGLALAELEEDDVEEDRKADWKLFRALRDVDAHQVLVYRRFLERNTPYVTKHGVKGDEFDTVVVVLDDKGARWNMYSFANLLSGADKSEARFRRTSNLFYVCCSRAQRNLVVIDLSFSAADRPKIDALFGPGNVIVVE